MNNREILREAASQVRLIAYYLEVSADSKEVNADSLLSAMKYFVEKERIAFSAINDAFIREVTSF